MVYVKLLGGGEYLLKDMLVLLRTWCMLSYDEVRKFRCGNILLLGGGG